MPNGRGFTSFSPPARSIANHKLKMSKEEVIDRVVACVKRAKSYCSATSSIRRKTPRAPSPTSSAR